MPDILLKNITKTFDEGRVIAVSDVDLAINDGDYVFILGPSGCGKTTLLRTISGLIQPTFGNILLDGKDVTDDPPQSRSIAFVFQDFNIFPISVWENCTYALNVQGYDEDYIIETLIPKSLKIQFYKVLLDSYASEHGARMTAMHMATENADDLIKELNLTYNKARQAAITKEILEIVGGAEALKG